MLYKITHNLDQSMYLVPQTTTITRNTSSLHYQIFSTLTDCYKHSFFHIVTLWNCLTHSYVSGGSLGQFKTVVQN